MLRDNCYFCGIYDSPCTQTINLINTNKLAQLLLKYSFHGRSLLNILVQYEVYFYKL